MVTLAAPRWMRVLSLLVHVYPFVIPRKKNGIGAGKKILNSVRKFLSCTTTWDDRKRLGCPTIYGFHPHSKYPMGIFLLLSGSDTDSSLQDVTVAQSSLGKFIPTIALVTALYGEVIDATKGEIKGILKRGKDVGLFPGGQREMIYCKPGSNVIPIVKHIGFLRVAMEEGSTVTPTFTFGFNNSFTSIGNEFDMWCFEKLGSNLPFWMPTGLWGGSEPRMVVGKEIDPHNFASVEELADEYFKSLNTLYESKKASFGGSEYTSVVLDFVEVDGGGKHNGKAKKRSVFSHVAIAKFSIPFSALVLGFLLLRGHATQFSTSSTFPLSRHSLLILHLTSSLVWSFASILNIKRGYITSHRTLGYIGYASAISMSYSACRLSLLSLSTPHLMFHSLCNLQVALVTVYLLTAGVAAAVGKTGLHGWYARTAHLVLGVNFLPRVMALVFRWYLGMNGETAFSSACTVQVAWQTRQISKAQRGEKKKAIVDANLWCLAVAAAVEGMGIKGIARTEIVGIIVAAGAGWVKGGSAKNLEGSKGV